MNDFDKVGTARDMSRRVTRARVDDVQRISKVLLAWQFIYEKNYAVDSKVVEDVLKSESLVPTIVSNLITLSNSHKLTSALECVFRKAGTPWFRHLLGHGR